MQAVRWAVLAILVLGLGAASAHTYGTDAELRRAVEAANSRFTSALNRGDVEAAMSVYADGAMILTANRDPVRGEAAIRDHWQGILAAGVVSGRLETLEVHGLGEFAYERGRYTVFGADEQVLDRGNYLTVWRRTPGGWKTYRDSSSSSVPLPDAATGP